MKIRAALVWVCLAGATALLVRTARVYEPGASSSSAARARLDAQRRGWPAYGGGPEQIRYSGLSQINRENVRQLEIAWTFDSGEQGGLQTNPIVVDGVLYTTTPKHRVVALDAATGRQLWSFGTKPGSGPNRGVMYWAGGGDRRIFAAQQHYVYALDARTGKPIASFGRDGRIDLREDLGREPSEQSIALTSPWSRLSGSDHRRRTSERKPACHTG